VQGVFFRDRTRARAREAGVTGWVRNRDDGSVEAWLEGEAAAVATVEAWIHAGGPRRAQVEDVAVEEVAPEGHHAFQIVR